MSQGATGQVPASQPGKFGCVVSRGPHRGLLGIFLPARRCFWIDKKLCYCLNLALFVLKENIVSPVQCNGSCNDIIKSLGKGSEGLQESLVNLVRLRLGSCSPEGMRAGAGQQDRANQALQDSAQGYVTVAAEP